MAHGWNPCWESHPSGVRIPHPPPQHHRLTYGIVAAPGVDAIPHPPRAGTDPEAGHRLQPHRSWRPGDVSSARSPRIGWSRTPSTDGGCPPVTEVPERFRPSGRRTEPGPENSAPSPTPVSALHHLHPPPRDHPGGYASSITHRARTRTAQPEMVSVRRSPEARDELGRHSDARTRSRGALARRVNTMPAMAAPAGVRSSRHSRGCAAG
jgi:hypothetical protein